MSLECDYALLGTGLAPLLAAQSLQRLGHSVLILNPDHDFFRENSEMPLEPILAGALQEASALDSISLQKLERARAILAPEFPGALEQWPREGQEASYQAFRDAGAPFMRARQWNWIPRSFDDAFLRFLEAGLNPRSTQGLAAARRFPGYNWHRNLDPTFHSLSLDRIIDIDLDRYRNGVLEFVRSRVRSERMLTSVSAVELFEGGIRFFHRGSAVQSRVSKGLWVFWTPRVTSWLEKLHSNLKQGHLLPPPRLLAWEEWSLRSREPIDPSQVGITDDGIAWARCEGEPRESIMELEIMMPSEHGAKIAGGDSFLRVSRFVQNFLNWDRFRIRDLKTRVLLGVPESEWNVNGAPIPVRVMSGCEGALVGLVDRVVRFSARGVS